MLQIPPWPLTRSSDYKPRAFVCHDPVAVHGLMGSRYEVVALLTDRSVTGHGEHDDQAAVVIATLAYKLTTRLRFLGNYAGVHVDEIVHASAKGGEPAKLGFSPAVGSGPRTRLIQGPRFKVVGMTASSARASNRCQAQRPVLSGANNRRFRLLGRPVGNPPRSAGVLLDDLVNEHGAIGRMVGRPNLRPSGDSCAG